MKKIFSFLLSFAMVLGIGSTVYAAELPTTSTDGKTTIPMIKNYVRSNANSISPEEKFTFKIVSHSVSNSFYESIDQVGYPAWPTDQIEFSYSAGDTIDQQVKNLTLPAFDRTGIYTYKIAETNNKVAGVTYDANPRFIKVTVVNDEKGNLVPKVSVRTSQHGDDNKLPDPIESDIKIDLEFNNTYQAGELSVTKEVTGNLGDKQKLFDVTVEFTKPAELDIKSTITYVDFLADNESNTEGIKISIKPEEWNGKNTVSKTFKVKHDTTVTFTNIPKGVNWKVSEKSYESDGYATSYETVSEGVGFASGTINTDETDAVKIVNYKNADVDTGISLDSIPYILILGLAVVGIGALFFRKRENANF